MKITVLGAGAWGTALGLILHRNGHQVTLWVHNHERLAEIQQTRQNRAYLSGVELPSTWHLISDLNQSLDGSECVIMAVPSKAFREIATALVDFKGLAVSVTKGIEHQSGLTMCGILRSVMPGAQVVALSGPTLALEVAKSIPSAIVAASEKEPAAKTVQELFHCQNFRVYTSSDPLGVELGGALKNVIAIGAGICDGLGFGDNAKAALVTRAIAEIRRLGVACGARPETFAGLSGLGDLTVTCFSKLSRNRGFGERIGRGEKIQDILSSTTSVAEGYPTAKSAYHLARKQNVVTPIIDEVYAMLYENKDVASAIRDLTMRDSKAED